MEFPQPVIPKCVSLTIHSGNILHGNILTQNPRITPTEELKEAIAQTVQAWLCHVDQKTVEEATDVVCENKPYIEIYSDEDRTDLKLTVKLFLTSFDSKTFQNAVDSVFQHLNPGRIDRLLVAYPSPKDEEISLTHAMPVWKEVELLVNDERVISPGVCDFKSELFQQLFEAAEVKPKANQINLASCCVIPPELSEFANQNSILLLTHNDPAGNELLPSEQLQQVLSRNMHVWDGESWSLQWVARYTYMLEGRGIVRSKGFLLAAERPLRYGSRPS